MQELAVQIVDHHVIAAGHLVAKHGRGGEVPPVPPEQIANLQRYGTRAIAPHYEQPIRIHRCILEVLDIHENPAVHPPGFIVIYHGFGQEIGVTFKGDCLSVGHAGDVFKSLFVLAPAMFEEVTDQKALSDYKQQKHRGNQRPAGDARFSERSQNLPEKDQEEDAAVQEIAGVGPVGNPNRQHHKADREENDHEGCGKRPCEGNQGRAGGGMA